MFGLVTTLFMAGYRKRWSRRRTAAQPALVPRMSEGCSQVAAELSAELIVLTDTEGVIQYASPACMPFLGDEAARLAGRNLFERIHPDDLAATRAWVARSWGEDADAHTAMFRLGHVDGTWRWIAARGARMIERGNATLLIVGHDDTERMRLEANLLHLQKCDSSERMTGAIGHDINNVLTGIASIAMLGMQTLPPGHEVRGDLQAIGYAAEHAASLACRLRSVARAPDVAPRPLDLNALIARLARFLERMLGPGIDVHMALAVDLGRMSGDEAQLEQVVLNLAINARDAMPGGGRLRIETANIIPDVCHTPVGHHRSPRAYVRLTISDTGMGMDAATQARIFEPCFTTKAPGRGSGLGLATCAEIVKRHNGLIRVDSAPGHGTVVTIELPCAIEDQVERDRLLAREAFSAEKR